MLRNPLVYASEISNQAIKRINSMTDYQDLQRGVSKMANNMARFDAELRAVMAPVEQGEQDGCA